MTAMLKNFIGGEWVDGAGVTRNINPSNTAEVVGLYARASADETRDAIAAANPGCALQITAHLDRLGIDSEFRGGWA